MRVSEVVLRYLVENGIRDIFGIPSGTMAYIVDSMNDVKEINYIVTKNEAAASYSACKYAKVSQKLGVCIMSGSVGVANAMNGIAEAAQCHAPMLILSGYIGNEQKGLGVMHDLESVKFLKGVIKYTVNVTSSKNVMKELKKAMEIAMTHPRGPVNVEIPINVQCEDFTGTILPFQTPRDLIPDYKNLHDAIELIDSINKGLILIGGGCRGLGENIKALAEKLNWRLVTTHSAKGTIEEDFKLHMGNYGFPCTDLAKEYVDNGDYECVLVLGSSLGEVATLNFNESIAKRKLIHIDINKNVFNRAYSADVSIENNLEFAIDYLKEHVRYKQLDNDVIEPLNEPYINNHTGVSLRLLFENISNYLPKDTFYMSDMGETVAFIHKYLKIPKESDYECNINYGCMGSSVGSLGVSRINTKRQVAVFLGDASFYMNIMSELLTAKKYNMKIIFFVNNNSNLGYVNRGQKSVLGRTLDTFYDDYIDIVKIVQAMGIPAIKIKESHEISKLNEFIKDIDGPQVVELLTDSTEPMSINREKSISK